MTVFITRTIVLILTFLFVLKVGMLDGILGIGEDKKPAVKVEKPVVEKTIKPKLNRPETGVAINYQITYKYTTEKNTILFPSETSCYVAIKRLVPSYFRLSYGKMTLKVYDQSKQSAWWNVEKHKEMVKFFNTTCIEANK